MDLDFGHGFLPRIGMDNYKAVDRCIGPADLFATDRVDLPWAFVDGVCAEARPDLLGTLRANKTNMLIDTSTWRYRYEATMNVKRLASASWAPAQVVDIGDRRQVRQLVEASLRTQQELGAAAYLLPGWMPEHDDEDLRPALAEIFEAAYQLKDLDARPFIAFVGGSSQGLERMTTLIDMIPHFISAVYLQVSPFKPIGDSALKLENITSVYLYAASRGFKVIAGRSGALTPELRALGVNAADAGLGTGETFDRNRFHRIRRRETSDSSKWGGPRSRIYFPQLGLSLPASRVEELLEVPAVAAELTGCRLPCHRFRSDQILERAREHSLWARVTEAKNVAALPPSMRLGSVREILQQRRSTIIRVNSALMESGENRLNVRPVDNHIVWLSRASSGAAAA